MRLRQNIRHLFLTSIFWVYDGTARYAMLGEDAKMLIGELTRVGLSLILFKWLVFAT